MAVKESPQAISTDDLGPVNRMPSKFRNFIPSQKFPVEADRYVLYVNFCCPWAHRTIITLALKGLGGIVQLVEADSRDKVHGWVFTGNRGPDRDPLYGFKYVKELYLKADPHYNGRITVPMLWDKQTGTIVNNESSEIIRMLIESFDPLLPPERREINKGEAAFIPKHLRTQIEELNSWVYEYINNGVYKVGFANSQAAYDEHIKNLFLAFDRLEIHLSQPGHQPYLFGATITEADIRLYTTLIRFDIAYYTLFKCNVKMIRYEYPRLHDWLRRLYWNEGPETAGGVFRQTTWFDAIKKGYSSVATGNGIVPAGPQPHILPLPSSSY